MVGYTILKKISSLFDRKEKIEFLGIVMIAIFSALLQTVSIASIIPFTNLVMDQKLIFENNFLNYFYNLFNFSTTYSFTIFLGLLVLILIIFSNLIFALSIWLKISFVWKKNHNLSLDLLKKYLSFPYAYFLDKHSSDLTKNILSEVEQLTNSFFMPLLTLITSSIMVLVIFIILIVVNPVVALSAFVLFMIFYGLTFSYLKATLKERGEKRFQANTGRFTSVSEAIGGIKDIKALGRENYFFDKFSYHSSLFSKLQAWNYIVVNLPRYVIEIVAFGGVIILILILMGLGGTGKEIIPIVSFFVFAGYRLMPALQEIFRSITHFQFNTATLNRIYDDIKEKTDLIEEVEPLPFKKKISFNNVCFIYPNKKENVLIDITLEVPKGSSVGIVGATGGGKTTLIDLILGLFTPSRGSIKVDNQEINGSNIRRWQKNIGYVPQQVYLSDNTIACNIAFGIPSDQIDMNQIKRVAQIANIADFIEKELPSGYNTFIGERGVRLSGGQKQRISIARALYHNPEILVFDEATSSLDNLTEKAVLKAIDNVAKLKTMIIVAHRLKTIEHCDNLYLLDKGRIIAQGNYNYLLENNRQFQEMATTWKKD